MEEPLKFYYIRAKFSYFLSLYATILLPNIHRIIKILEKSQQFLMLASSSSFKRLNSLECNIISWVQSAYQWHNILKSLVIHCWSHKLLYSDMVSCIASCTLFLTPSTIFSKFSSKFKFNGLNTSNILTDTRKSSKISCSGAENSQNQQQQLNLSVLQLDRFEASNKMKFVC